MSALLITLFTDASHCHQTKLAAYAVWAKADGRAARHAGMLKDAAPTTGDAEVKALANGIHFVIAAYDPAPGSRIIAQADCTEALDALRGTSVSKKAIARHKVARDRVYRVLAKHGITIEYRHVKGHAGKGTPRAAVNDWCDKACRGLLRQARKDARAAPGSAS